MLSDAIIVEVLLAVLALMIGVGSFVGANRANKAPSLSPSQSEMDDIAADRAMKFYEASIAQLDAQVARLNERQDSSDKEINRLQEDNRMLHTANRQLKADITECKAYGARLEARLSKYEGENSV